MQESSSFRQTTKDRAGTPRPGTSPVKGQVSSQILKISSQSFLEIKPSFQILSSHEPTIG